MKPDIKQKADNLLTSVNVRKTRPRIAILAVLLTAQKPVTQNQVAERLGENHLNKVTIYRTLDTFVKAGLVHKAFLQQKTWHFELAHNCTKSQCHPHFTCTDCGQTRCLTGISLPMAKSPYKGFVIDHQRVQLEGLCPNCSTKAR